MLTDAAKAELSELSLEMRQLVLNGLYSKLTYHRRTGKMSFSYERCPVCNHMGATEGNAATICPQCPISYACWYPLAAGFKDDQEKSHAYFTEMLDYLLSKPCLLGRDAVVVGGTWGDPNERKASGVARKLANLLGADLHNGGPADTLPLLKVDRYDLVVWMPNISNNYDKVYPRKKVGAVLVCSKRMREGTTAADAAARIFAMHGNAVIQVRQRADGRYTFTLMDALSNSENAGSDLYRLGVSIRNLQHWTQSAVRVRTKRVAEKPILAAEHCPDVAAVLDIVRGLATEVQNQLGQRYFGNVSTRCTKLFPSLRVVPAGVAAFVSARNIDKQFVGLDDMVYVFQDPKCPELLYAGERKPSVDSGIQLELYRQLPEVNYMIHGHATIEGAPCTEGYFPCGDMREAGAVLKACSSGARVVNLTNHGFLILAETLDELKATASTIQLINRL